MKLLSGKVTRSVLLMTMGIVLLSSVQVKAGLDILGSFGGIRHNLQRLYRHVGEYIVGCRHCVPYVTDRVA